MVQVLTSGMIVVFAATSLLFQLVASLDYIQWLALEEYGVCAVAMLE